jgi:hypothetical protein
MPTKDTSVFYGKRVYIKDSISADPTIVAGKYQTGNTKLFRLRTGVSNPKYKQQVAARVGATTQLDGIFDSLEAHRSASKITFIWTPFGNAVQERQAYGDISAMGMAIPEYTPFASKADARAISKFLSKVRETEVRMSGPTFLGEIRETLRMLRRPAAGLMDGIQDYLNHVKELNRENRYRYFRKKPRQYARNLSKIASQSWLEHVFGWAPLLHDIEDAREAFNDLLELDRTVTVSGGGSDARADLSFTDSYNFTLLAGLLWERTYLKTSVETIRYRGGVRAQAATTAQDRLARFGFTPSEFVPTAWELLPWSFLADYFSNIGDVLSASVTDTSKVVWVNKSQVKQATAIQRHQIDRTWLKQTFVTPNTLLSVIDSPGFSVAKHRIVSRSTGNSEFMSPALYFTMPGFDTNPGKWLNIAALMAQVGLNIHPQRPNGRTFRL